MDNIVAPAAGLTFATDDVDGVQYPRTKITLGTDGANDGDVSEANPMPVKEVGSTVPTLLTRILTILMSPMGFDRSLSRQRVTAVVESGTVTTVTTVTTVASMTDFNAGGLPGRLMVWGANQSAWADCHRSRIS